jgi:hypothetical protein
MGCTHTQLPTVGFRLKAAVAFIEMPAREPTLHAAVFSGFDSLTMTAGVMTSQPAACRSKNDRFKAL